MTVATPASLQEARRKLGLTQSDAARLLGYGAAVRVSEIERGARQPSEAVKRLLQAYLDGYRPADWPTQEDGKISAIPAIRDASA